MLPIVDKPKTEFLLKNISDTMSHRVFVVSSFTMKNNTQITPHNACYFYKNPSDGREKTWNLFPVFEYTNRLSEPPEYPLLHALQFENEKLSNSLQHLLQKAVNCHSNCNFKLTPLIFENQVDKFSFVIKLHSAQKYLTDARTAVKNERWNSTVGSVKHILDENCIRLFDIK